MGVGADGRAVLAGASARDGAASTALAVSRAAGSMGVSDASVDPAVFASSCVVVVDSTIDVDVDVNGGRSTSTSCVTDVC